MRLWQKMFLATLFLVIVAINVMCALLIEISLETELNHVEEQKIVEQKNWLETLDEEVLFEKLKSENLVFTEEEFEQVIKSIVEDEERTNFFTCVYIEDGKTFSNTTRLTSDGLKEELDNLGDKNSILEIDDSYKKEKFLIKSTYILNNTRIYVWSEFDISNIFEQYNSNLSRIPYISFIVAIVIAAILLFMVQFVLYPLKKMKDTTNEIANGKYDKRISVRGNSEVAELAEDMNHMSAQIEKNVNDMEEVLENRTIFIGNMAHEMKTPLTSILGFAELISMKPQVNVTECREYAGIIINEATRLKNLSQKLMELINLKETSNILRKVDLYIVFQILEQLYKPIEEEKKIIFKWSYKNYEILGDYDLLQSLFINLIDNAVKHSKSGNIISISMIEDNNLISVYVKDEGSGIPKDEIKKVMEPFYMVDKARSRKEGGAGIGLALCKQIVDLHNGDISIESNENEGCTVIIKFNRIIKEGEK